MLCSLAFEWRLQKCPDMRVIDSFVFVILILNIFLSDFESIMTVLTCLSLR